MSLVGPKKIARPLAKRASWIWREGVTERNSYVEFRCFVRGSAWNESWIQLSAETSFRFWINAQLVYAGPAREVPPYFYYDTLDIRPLLGPGENELRVVAHHQGENSQSYQAGTPAVLVAGACEGAAGQNFSFANPANWQARRLTRYLPDAHRLFSCLGFSEHVDFNAGEDPWSPALLVGCHPWGDRRQALPDDLPPWREIIRPMQTAEPFAGGWIVDMGEEVSGYVAFCVFSDEPVSLRVAYAEALSEGGVDPCKGGMHYWDRLELPGGEVHWRSYEKRAFRFLHLDRAVTIRSLSVVEHLWPYERQWRASGKPDPVERIHEVSARTIELNTEDLLTDCPWRERAQYLDCQYYMGAMQKLFGTLEPVRRFLHQFPRGAGASGSLRMCYPSPAATTVIPDFSISYAILLRRYLGLSGDVETVRANLPFARRGVTDFRQYEDARGLLRDVPGWTFLDNTFELSKFPCSAGLNALYHGGCLALAELCVSCGEPAEAPGFLDQAARIRSQFRSAFLHDGRLWDSDSTPDHERFRQWVYHYSAESGRWRGASFRLRIPFRKTHSRTGLHLSAHAGSRAWIDGAFAGENLQGESWARSAVFERYRLNTPSDTYWHRLDLDIQGNGIDWECYMSGEDDIEWGEAEVWEEEAFGISHADDPPRDGKLLTALRRHVWPWMSQTTVGLAACHGLLDEHEARRLLGECLPADYAFPFAKKTTPFFARIGEPGSERRILPCNVPASLASFCHALRRFGMEEQGKSFLLAIYQGMLDRGATTWWEEWNTRSSLCHAWGSFVVEFLDLPNIAEEGKVC